jgi:hypothetical protein
VVKAKNAGKQDCDLLLSRHARRFDLKRSTYLLAIVSYNRNAVNTPFGNERKYGPTSRKARRGSAGRAREEGMRLRLLADSVSALATLGLEGLDGVPHAIAGRRPSVSPEAATISGDGVSPAASATARRSPPGSAAATCSADAGRFAGSTTFP